MASSSDRTWEIIKRVGVSMLTTRTSGGELRSRPVEARPNREEGCLYVVTDLRSAKEHEIERDAHIGLTYIDQKSNAYLALAGRAAVCTDRAKIKQYWRSTDSMWWQGPEDPNVCIVRVQLATGSLWDGPASKAVEIFEFINAKITGVKPNLGENRKSAVRLGPSF